MSTGKRLAKRSILGTRVCAPIEDGSYIPGVIQACKTDANDQESVYCVLLDDKTSREYKCYQLIGPGFQSVSKAVLKTGQKVYLTYHGREVSGLVVGHVPEGDDILISLQANQHGRAIVTKKYDEVRLLESRKSARLQDLDTDYSRLADGQSEPRRRASSLSIEVPTSTGGRKRRSSAEDNVMDDCMAAMVLMSLSCSPKSSRPSDTGTYSHSWASGSSCSGTHSPTRSPSSLSSHQGDSDFKSSDRFSPTQDEGIEMDETIGFLEENLPIKDKVTAKVVFQCTWPGCTKQYSVCEDIERHVCITHLGRNTVGEMDHEEEFYYTEIEVEASNNHHSLSIPIHSQNIYSSSVPTLSHLDMARPPHEDPEYRRHISEHPIMLETSSGPVNIPSSTLSMSWSLHGYAASAPSTMMKKVQLFVNFEADMIFIMVRGPNWLGRTDLDKSLQNDDSPFFDSSGKILGVDAQSIFKGSSPQKFLRLTSKSTCSLVKVPLHRKGRSESRKCRKVYGMDNREAWCTQCKWKKACSRFID